MMLSRLLCIAIPLLLIQSCNCTVVSVQASECSEFLIKMIKEQEELRQKQHLLEVANEYLNKRNKHLESKVESIWKQLNKSRVMNEKLKDIKGNIDALLEENNMLKHKVAIASLSQNGANKKQRGLNVNIDAILTENNMLKQEIALLTRVPEPQQDGSCIGCVSMIGDLCRKMFRKDKQIYRLPQNAMNHKRLDPISPMTQSGAVSVFLPNNSEKQVLDHNAELWATVAKDRNRWHKQ